MRNTKLTLLKMSLLLDSIKKNVLMPKDEFTLAVISDLFSSISSIANAKDCDEIELACLEVFTDTKEAFAFSISDKQNEHHDFFVINALEIVRANVKEEFKTLEKLL